jgi:hypothetical protein
MSTRRFHARTSASALAKRIAAEGILIRAPQGFAITNLARFFSPRSVPRCRA